MYTATAPTWRDVVLRADRGIDTNSIAGEEVLRLVVVPDRVERVGLAEPGVARTSTWVWGERL